MTLPRDESWDWKLPAQHRGAIRPEQEIRDRLTVLSEELRNSNTSYGRNLTTQDPIDPLLTQDAYRLLGQVETLEWVLVVPVREEPK